MESVLFKNIVTFFCKYLQIQIYQRVRTTYIVAVKSLCINNVISVATTKLNCLRESLQTSALSTVVTALQLYYLRRVALIHTLYMFDIIQLHFHNDIAYQVSNK